MNIGDQGNIDFCLPYFFTDLPQSLSCTNIGGSDPDNFTTGLGEFDRLSGGGGNIQSIGCGHGLDPNGVVSTNLQMTDLYCP